MTDIPKKTIREWAEMYASSAPSVEKISKSVDDKPKQPTKIKKTVVRDAEGRISEVIEEHIYD